MKAWIDGALVPREEARTPILSHGFSRGSAIFEVLDVVALPEGPALFRVDAHMDRLLGSAELMHMSLPLTKGELVQAVKSTVRANGLGAGAVKLFAYWAMPELGLIPADPRVSIAVFCFDLPEVLGDDPFRPVSAGISNVRKLSPGTVAVQAKVAGHYVNAFLARWQAVARGHDDAILLDESGHVVEGPLSNVFCASGGALVTPKLSDALAGITRDSVIEVARGMGLPVAEADVTAEQAASADEAFYTGSVVRVRPIRAIEGRDLGDRCPGPITEDVRRALDDAYEGRDGRYLKWLTPVG